MARFSLISSDSHVTMPVDAWQEYLDPEFRDRAPRIERTDEGDFRVFEGKRTPIMTLDNLAGKKPEEFKLNEGRPPIRGSDKAFSTSAQQEVEQTFDGGCAEPGAHTDYGVEEEAPQRSEIERPLVRRPDVLFQRQ